MTTTDSAPPPPPSAVPGTAPSTTSSAVPGTAPATAEEAVLVTLMRLGRKLRQRLPGESLDFAAIVTLKALHQRGPMRLSQLATVLEVDASTVSRQVRALEEQQLLRRSDDPDDARASRVALTDEGRARLHAGADRRRALVAELLADWPAADRDTLRDLLNRLLSHLDHPEHP